MYIKLKISTISSTSISPANIVDKHSLYLSTHYLKKGITLYCNQCQPFHGILYQSSEDYLHKLHYLLSTHYTYNKVSSPDPSLSYILNAQRSFSSGSPLLVMSVAIMNSLKSMLPSPSLSKIRNSCSRNWSPASPCADSTGYMIDM